MFDQVGVGLARIDGAGTIRHANRRLGEWLGQSVTSLAGTPLAGLFHGVDEPVVEGAVRHVASVPSEAVTVTLSLATEPTHRVEAELVPLEACAEPREILVTLRSAAPPSGVANTTDDHSPAVSRQQLFDSLVEGVFAVDRERRLTFINPAARRMLGLPDESKVLGADSHTLLHHSDALGSRLPPDSCPILKVMETGERLQEWSDCFWRDNETCFPVRVHAAPLEDAQGTINGAVVSFRDESAWKEGEERLAKAVRHLPGAVYQYRRMPDGREGFPYVSGGVQDLFGVSADEAMRHPARVLAMVHRADLGRLRATIEESARTLKTWHLHFRVNHPVRGRVIWVEGRSTPERLPDGGLVWHGVLIDITRRMEVEGALRERERELAEAQRIARVGNWVWNPQDDRLQWSDEFGAVFGRKGGGLNRLDAMLGSVDTGDRERLRDRVDQAVAGRRDLDLEVRLARRDGYQRVVHVRGSMTTGVDGEPRLIGTAQDVTRQHELQENQQRLVDILERTPDMVAMHGASGEMLFLNAAGRRLFGLPESPGQPWDPETGWNVRGLPSDTQSLESTVRRFQPPEEARRMIEQVGPVALRDGIWEGESRVLDARGREVPVSQAILVTRDAQGRMQQLSTIVRDLSRQKAVERALRESETRFRQMAESVNEIFWLSDPDEVLYINPAYEWIMGRSRQEAYESPDALLDAVHPDDHQRVSEEMKGVGSRQRTIDMTFRVVQADGDTRWVRMRRYPVADAEGRGDRVAGTVVDVTELKRVELELERANALLEHQALYDALTNVANRRQFDILLDREVARVDRYGGSFALIMFDLDHFKSVNDEHGHAVGDQVLEATARVIEDRLRKSDVLGRWGGEEFMVLMSDTDLDDAVQAAEAMRQRVASYRYPGVGPVTISLGVAAYHPGGSRTDLLRDVDESMYRAKREGRNRVVAGR